MRDQPPLQCMPNWSYATVPVEKTRTNNGTKLWEMLSVTIKTNSCRNMASLKKKRPYFVFLCVCDFLSLLSLTKVNFHLTSNVNNGFSVLVNWVLTFQTH